jgi:hypothetical protein
VPFFLEPSEQPLYVVDTFRCVVLYLFPQLEKQIAEIFLGDQRHDVLLIILSPWSLVWHVAILDSLAPLARYQVSLKLSIRFAPCRTVGGRKVRGRQEYVAVSGIGWLDLRMHSDWVLVAIQVRYYGE